MPRFAFVATAATFRPRLHKAVSLRHGHDSFPEQAPSHEAIERMTSFTVYFIFFDFAKEKLNLTPSLLNGPRATRLVVAGMHHSFQIVPNTSRLDNSVPGYYATSC